MPPDESALIEALQAAAAGEFKPWFYRVKVGPRKWKRCRMPGMASRVSPKEALAMQAFRLFRDVVLANWPEGFSANAIPFVGLWPASLTCSVTREPPRVTAQELDGRARQS